MSEHNQPKSNSPNAKRQITDSEMDQVRESLSGLLFGSVSIVVQDGFIVQIDRTEKRRIQRGELRRGSPVGS